MNVGIVGIGFMGMIHYLAYPRVRGAKVVTIATRDKKKLAGDWREIKGNFGPPGEQMDLSGVKGYRDWKDLIADPKIDLVDICLPPDLHASVALAALKAGKHVLVEKPIALTVPDAERIVVAADKAGKQLLIGQVLPFFPEYAFALKAITSGKYGRLLGAHFKRIIADPAWIPDFFDPDKIGGPVVDLHIHDAHFIRLVCGMPESVFSAGRLRGKVVEFFTSQFQFADRTLAVSATSGVTKQQGRSFTHGFEIHLERATLLFDFQVIEDKPTVNIPLTVLGAGGKVSYPTPEAGDAFVAELSEVARSVKSGKPSKLLSGDLALDALRMCQAQTQSVRERKVVKIAGRR